MTSFVYFFAIAFVLSFIGSLQPGPVNSEVMVQSVIYSKTRAFLVCLGGSLPEFLYATLAIILVDILPELHQWSYFDYLKLTLLGAFTVYFGMQKVPTQETSPLSESNSSFLKGLTLGILNLQLLPFWMGVLLFLSNDKYSVKDQMSTSYSFVIGAWLGAFCLLLLLMFFSNRNKISLHRSFIFRNIYRIMTFLFFSLFLIQLILIAFL